MILIGEKFFVKGSGTMPQHLSLNVEGHCISVGQGVIATPNEAKKRIERLHSNREMQKFSVITTEILQEFSEQNGEFLHIAPQGTVAGIRVALVVTLRGGNGRVSHRLT